MPYTINRYHIFLKMSAVKGIPIVTDFDLCQQIDRLKKLILENDKKIVAKIADMEKQQEEDRSQIVIAGINHRLCRKIFRLEAEIEHLKKAISHHDEEFAVMRRENEALRQTVVTLDEKITALMTKVDELENDSIVNDYLVNQRVDRSQDDIGELQVMVFPSHLTEYPQ